MTDTTSTRSFVTRHNGPRTDDVATMLDVIGVATLDELIGQAVPDSIHDETAVGLPPALTEVETLRRLRELAAKNTVYTSMIGTGYSDTVTPGVIQRNILEAPGWYTAYTPYQAEISQGRLEALLNFQTMVIDLTGMEIANASLLDEATAAAEAMAMLARVDKQDRTGFFVDAASHPQTIEVVHTRAEPLGIKVTVGDPTSDVIEDDTFGVLLQYPGTRGDVRDDSRLIAALAERGIRVAVAADLLGLALMTPPGEMGVDVVIGSTQRFGVPLFYGGPHAAYMATRDEYKRSMPGRLVGVSKDAHDRTALRLALTTREQHIRREKATSNICTAQVLLAVIAGMYAVYHGPDGLRDIATRVHRHTSALAGALRAGGLEIVNDTWFDTITVRVPNRADEVIAAAEDRRINLRHVNQDLVGVSVDEVTTPAVLDAVLEAFLVDERIADHLDAAPGIPPGVRRTSDYLTHPVFNLYRSETEMLRYIRRLRDKDIALDRSMIPLGSCTMKLNATTEMIPVSWPEFAGIHPFAPLDQAAGYLELFKELEDWLAKLTGYDAISLQPNAGSQGEYSGLLAIRNYHASRGEAYRDVCLIPASAHGTNPASAVMAGLDVVVVGTDDDGNIDVGDLRAKVDEHGDRLAALMITYPSTHGVFESTVREVTDLVHAAGGQVYIDGANLNALVGVARFGAFGGDVSHLNLHKTFTIPHGGGGPGVGPIGVKAHLEPFLPGHPLVHDQDGHRDGIGAVSAAPWGSAGILPISYAYIAMMGEDGLREATKIAVLGANYIAARLEGHFDVLYRGENGRVAHECIIDLRHFKRDAGVTADDVAKRLIDYGFHAPTMSFPVAGTLMIEPTESESLAELDRFCDAMLAIEAEIAAVASGEIDIEESPLRHAPHTAYDVVVGEWDRPYTREQAAYPARGLAADKYWPPVSRVDNQFGDRNVVCACPPIEAYG